MNALVLDASLVEAWLQCERRAWLRVHAPGEGSMQAGLDRYLAEQRADLRALLRQRFVQTSRSDAEVGAMRGGRVRTLAALARGEPLIFDATFEAQVECDPPAAPPLRLRGRVDVLERTEDGWTMAILAAGTRVRAHHVRRLALARLAGEETGIAAGGASVMHVERRPPSSAGTAPLRATDVTERSAQESRRLQRLLPAVAASLAAQAEPKTVIGGHCHRPRRCPFVDHCWPEVGAGGIYQVWGLRGATRRALRSAGWLRLDQIPTDVPGLSPDERRTIRDARAGTVRVEHGELRSALERLRPPIAYLDLEFATPAVPWVDGMAPFEPLPFQFSVDIEEGDGHLRHAEGLVLEPGTDPRPVLARALAGALEDASSIVVYDATAEGPLLAGLQAYAPVLGPAAERLWDLLEVVRGTLRHPGFGARWDLKQVAATLAPESYLGVQLADGLAAQALWRRMLRRADRAGEADLRHYCAADSRAMVEVVRVLRGWVTPAPGSG